MKKLAFIAIAAMLAFSGCSGETVRDNTGNESNINTENTGEPGDQSLDIDEVRKYMPDDDKYRLYHGYAEAGFEIKFLRTEDDGLVYVYEGSMNDERGTENGEPRTFEVTYTIDDNAVVESVENNDYMADSQTTLYSKIEDMIVLQGPIEEGNSWEQAVEIDGTPTVLETTITEVTDDSFSTVSMADAEGYKDGKYTEERTYTKGIGLTSFSNTPYGSDKDDLLIFGYNFSVENDESVTGME